MTDMSPGMNFLPSPPDHPSPGDAYWDKLTGELMLFNGRSWMRLMPRSGPRSLVQPYVIQEEP